MNHSYQEYVLDDDGRFCRRTIVTTPIADADTILADIKDNGTPVYYPFDHCINVPGIDGQELPHTMRFMTYSTTHNLLHVVTSLPYFPFKGAHLQRTEEDSDSYNVHIPVSSREQRLPDVQHGNLKWLPIMDGYYLFSYVSYNFLESTAGQRYIFAVKDNKGYFPNLPNVFDDGRLCAGHDYESFIRDGKSFKSVMNTHAKNLQLFYNAPCNNDLRNYHIEAHAVLFDEDGNTKSAPNKELASRFYTDCTHSVINDFIRKVTNV
jgi:hypothetical protein